MNLAFNPFQQPPGSNSCIPTCVRAVLSWHGQDFTEDEVSEWCGQAADGCEYSNALLRLQDKGFDVEEIDEEDDLLEVFEETDPEPVIIMIRTPNMTPNSDHAVVVHAVQHQDGATHIIDFMDPIVGANLQNTDGLLLRYWNVNGCRAFIIRPI